MYTFSYKARDNSGKLVRGVLDCLSQKEVAEKLQEMRYTPITITEANVGLKFEQFTSCLRRIKTDDIVMLNLQFANMLNAGLNITTALEILQKQCSNKKLGKIIGGISRGVQAGESLSEAFAKYPRVFPELFISMVKVAEVSGELGKILNRYAEFIEAQADLQRKVKEALYYPVILIAAAIGVIVFLSTFLIPQFVDIFKHADISLPLPTIILYVIGTSFRQYWYLIILACVLITAGIGKYIKTNTGKLRFDSISLKLPIVGRIVLKTCISRFARTLSTLVGSGVSILESLDIVSKVVNNQVIGLVIEQTRQSIEKGGSLAESLRMSNKFPADAIQMIAVGEESGNLEAMLNKISDFYDRTVGYSIKRMVASLEPILLLAMGVVVAFTMASMLLPMFNMVKLLKR